MSNPPFNIKDWARNEDDPRWTLRRPPRRRTRTTPGSSTSSASSRRAAAPASSWPTAPCRRTPAAKARSVRRSSRPTSSPAWSPCPPSSSAAPASPSACGSSPRTRQAALAARSTAPGRCSSSTPATSATWSTALSAPCRTTTSRNRRHLPRLAWHTVGLEGLAYGDVAGFCKSVTLAEIKDYVYALTPGRYVGAAEAEDDGEPIEAKIERLTNDLLAHFDEARGSSRSAGATRTPRMKRLQPRSGAICHPHLRRR